MYIDNSVGDLKNDVWHKVVYDGIDIPMIYEMRKIKGVFLENLELNDFPVDVQVNISSSFFSLVHHIRRIYPSRFQQHEQQMKFH